MTSTSSTRTSRIELRGPLAGVAVLAALLTAAEPARAGDARAAVQATVDDVLAALADGALNDAEKRGRIEAIAEEHFDFERMSKLVLGRNRRKLNEEQQAEFAREFQRHLALTYGRRLNRFTDESVALDDEVEHSNGDVTIKTVIVGGNADGVTMDYRMRARDDSWYAIDIIIEDVSLIANFRSQIQEIVSSQGASEVIRVLREKNEREAQEPASQE